jgi:hypothetical protein
MVVGQSVFITLNSPRVISVIDRLEAQFAMLEKHGQLKQKEFDRQLPTLSRGQVFDSVYDSKTVHPGIEWDKGYHDEASSAPKDVVGYTTPVKCKYLPELAPPLHCGVPRGYRADVYRLPVIPDPDLDDLSTELKPLPELHNPVF